LGQEGTPLISQIEMLGTQLRQTQDELVAEAEAEVGNRQNQAGFTLIVVLAAALLLGLALALLLPRRLARNLDKLVTAARGIERGDLDQRLEITSGDEVEELGHRFVEMQAGLKRLQQLALQDRELEIAASIQRNLLQRTIPEPRGAALVPIQKQANLVGGDWYDFEMSGDSLTMVIGDASGKGIAAALMATVMLSSLRAERGLGAGPKRVIQRANKALMDATDADSFTTIIYLIADLDTGDVRWFNMGHPPPFLLREDEEEGFTGHYVEGPRNKALGWFDDPGVEDTELKLERGDRLILFTDGFVEAKDGDGELFGEERLAGCLLQHAALNPQELGDAVVNEVEGFAGGTLGDDLTMLVLDYEGRRPAPEESEAEVSTVR
jgi:sigma-B regulation protein RsbU (phosphoserine phosphatase)